MSSVVFMRLGEVSAPCNTYSARAAVSFEVSTLQAVRRCVSQHVVIIQRVSRYNSTFASLPSTSASQVPLIWKKADESHHICIHAFTHGARFSGQRGSRFDGVPTILPKYVFLIVRAASRTERPAPNTYALCDVAD